MARGWYLLPHSGLAYHGTLPPGAKECDPPPGVEVSAAADRPAPSGAKKAWAAYVTALASGFEEIDDLAGQVARLNKADLVAVADALEQAVKGDESGTPVWPEMTGVDLGPDPEKVTSAPGEGDQVDAQDGTP